MNRNILIMKKKLLLLIGCITLQTATFAQAPKWVEKAKKAVFSVVAYDENNQIYHQSEHYTVKDAATGKPVFEVKKNKNSSIDFSQTLEDKL